MYIVYRKDEMAHDVVRHIGEYDGLWEVKCAYEEEEGNYIHYHTGLHIRALRNREVVEDNPEMLSKKSIAMEHSPLLVMAKIHPMPDMASRGLMLCDTVVPIDRDDDEELVITFLKGESVEPPYEEGDSIAMVSIELAIPAEWEVEE